MLIKYRYYISFHCIIPAGKFYWPRTYEDRKVDKDTCQPAAAAAAVGISLLFNKITAVFNHLPFLNQQVV